MAETNITEEEMRQFGIGIPEPTDVPTVDTQGQDDLNVPWYSSEAGQQRTRALEDALEYYIPKELQQPIKAFNEYVNPVTSMGEAQVDTQRAFNPELSTSERLKAAGSALLNTGLSSVPLFLAAKRYLTPAQAAVDTLVGFGNTTPDVPAGATDDLIKSVDEFSGVTPTPVATPATPSAPERTLFREGTTSNVADFYSPARELLDTTNYPSKGLKGSEAIKLLRNAPDVRQAEIDLLSINPQQRYTREELLDLVDNNSYTITAERPTSLTEEGTYEFAGTQRQPLSNNYEQLDYEETILRAQNPNQRVVAREGTHHTSDTIAHLRTSRQQNMDTGEKIYLVEEIQSDLVSRGSRQPRGEVTPLQGIMEDADLTLDMISEAKAEFKDVVTPYRDLLRDYYLYSVSQAQRATENAGREIPTVDFIEKYGLRTNNPNIADINSFLFSSGVPLKTVAALTDTIGERSIQTAFKTDADLAAPIGNAPIKDINEVVRLGLQTAISDALANGDTKVVIPNLERIVAADRARPGTEDWDNMTRAGSSFHRMYVTGLQKAISELQKDLPELSVGSMDLSYSRYPDLPSNATVLDLSAYSDQNLNTLRFAEGGLATERQMNRLMAEGGLNDDGMRMDPVSGNEVPPGSMAEEVRDDIPAQLSGGEYVVPADVVRYYGVKFFEDLRGEAKGGLMEMEQDGRIGGEPVMSDAAPALSEQDMAMLQQLASQQGGAVGMAEGGMATQQPQQMGGDQLIDNIIKVAKADPMLMSKLNSKGVMLAEGGFLNGYADGGFTPSFDPSSWSTVGGSYFGNQPSTGYLGPIENRTYRGPNGETVTIRFQNGVAMDPIPAGYVPEGDYKPVVDTATNSGNNNSNNDTDRAFGLAAPSQPGVSTTPEDPTKYRGVSFDDPLGAAQEAISASQGNLTGRLAAGVAGSINPMLGMAVQQGIVMNGLANARANLEIAKRRGLDEEAAKIEALIEERTKSLGMGQNVISNVFGSGQGIADNAWEQFTQAGLTGAATTPAAAIQAARTSGTESESRGVTYRSDSSDGGESFGVRTATGPTAPTSSPRPVARPSNLNTSTATTTPSSSKSATERAKEAADKLGKSLATGGRAEGGLMGKPKKV